MKYPSTKVPGIKKRALTTNSSPIKHQTASTNSTASSQSSSPVIKKLKEDLKLAKSAIRTCPICSEGMLNFRTQNSFRNHQNISLH